MEKPIKPARLPDNSNIKVMWGALAVIVMSFVSVSLSDKMFPNPKTELTMLPMESINSSPNPSQRSSACQKLYTIFCADVYDSTVCPLVEDACEGEL